MKAPALTIRKRIYGGSAILVAVSIGLAIFAVDQATTTGAQVVRLGLLSDNNTRVLQVDRNLEGIRRTARSYKTNGDPVALKENREVVARTTQTLTDASKATLSDERRRGYEDLKEDLVKYSAKMDTQVSLTNDMIRNRSKLFQGGDELTATTNRLMEAVHKQNDPNLNVLAANVEAAILLVRVSNWRYLATLDPKGPVTFKTNTEKAGAAITGLEASAGLAADIRALIGQLKTTLAAYVDTFQLLSSGMVATDAVFDNESRPLVLKMQNSVNTLRDSIQESYTNTQESTKQVVLNSIRTQQAMGIIVFLVGSGIALLLSRGLIRPIAGMTTAMSALADGDTNVVVPMRDAPDEMGAMAKAVDVFKDNAIERRRLEESQKQREADAAMEKQRAMEALANTFEDAVSEIIETVSASASQLEASAHSLTATATRSEEVTTTVAAASEEASVNVHSVAAATEELTSSVHEISRQVQASARIASEAVEQAGKTNGQIALLSEAANRIGNVVQLISTIAGQTNLLALNATIEAARAGEAGRGFAVVASEVKTLAKQTADATYEISQQIAGMQAATGQSVDAIQEIGATIGTMSEISSAIASAVEQQNAATQEISNNVQQAAQGTQEVSSHITGVQRGAAETGSASSQVLSAAQSLARDSQRLKSEVTKFLHTVRAAA